MIYKRPETKEMKRQSIKQYFSDVITNTRSETDAKRTEQMSSSNKTLIRGRGSTGEVFLLVHIDFQKVPAGKLKTSIDFYE